jgi:S-adenosylmethionine synthetase
MVETYGTGRIADEKIQELINKHFDLRPGAIIRDLNLRRPIYRATASYGHFGRTDIDAPWERTDKADLLRKEAGLPADVKLEVLVPSVSADVNGHQAETAAAAQS